jgi:hypothetical protein
MIVYLQRRLIPAVLPPLSAAALTPAWLLGITTSARIAGLRAYSGAPGWDALFASPFGHHALPSLAAALLIVLLTWLLLATVTSTPRRVAAARSAPPPADGAIDAET